MVSNEPNEAWKVEEEEKTGKKLIYCKSYPRLHKHSKSMKIAALETIRCDTLRFECKSDRVKYEAEQIKQMYCNTNAIFININNKKRDDVAPHKIKVTRHTHTQVQFASILL